MIPVSDYILMTTLFLAFVSSIIRFRFHPMHLKIISVLLAIDLVNELLASVGMPFLRSHFQLQGNNAIYNSFVLIEFTVYAVYFLQIIRLRSFRKIIIGFIILFPVLWIVSVFFIFRSINVWNSYIHVAGSAFTIIACAIYFYQLYTEDDVESLTRNTEFWIATALFIFYTCNLPYTGMLNYLTTNYMDVAENLSFVLQMLNIVMYSFIIYAFLCRPISTTRSS